MKCWSCQAETGGQALCPSCGKLGPPTPGATHFDTLGVPRAFAQDAASLDRRFRELSLRLHPDRLAGADARERRYSLEQTTSLNEAYQTLKDPVRRAFYLLRLHGIDLDREDGGTQKDMPPELLEEVLERREALEVARQAGDLEAARQMANDVEKERAQALGRARTELETLEENGRSQDASTLQRAAHALGQVRYFSRFLDEVEAMEEELTG